MAKGRGSGLTPIRVVELLKKAVLEKNQSTVSRETGLTLFTVQRCVKGIGEPTTATLEKLADYFGVTVGYLRGEYNIRIGSIKTDLNDIAAKSLSDNIEKSGDITLKSRVRDFNADLCQTLLDVLDEVMTRISNREDVSSDSFRREFIQDLEKKIDIIVLQNSAKRYISSSANKPLRPRRKRSPL